ncbi:hypothetical protein CF392_02880 [Tamilnaduibacter salinus]|uniref:Mut7-C RNAse domain-containing protein n=1 Tax=Tamilnaduibacter salinus TaxID=1484056 RepID=A0A2A2I682_9GAMM|nr:DUF5615 family PIN-like protein [Tamilnaduibacter salinus]PAV27092.1 hypothetical protein CF392_02880 [Tamilnaduibacter salinus]
MPQDGIPTGRIVIGEPGAEPRAPFCPVAPLRFLCDEMLNGFAQWLRVAGYDTVVPTPGQPDRQLMAQARDENRWLITADDDLLQFADAPLYVIHLTADSEESRRRELTLRVDLDWCVAPFSRCKTCNTPLERASDWQIVHFHPGAVPADQTTVWACPACRQLFWEGNHVRRMRGVLETMNGWRKPRSD